MCGAARRSPRTSAGAAPTGIPTTRTRGTIAWPGREVAELEQLAQQPAGFRAKRAALLALLDDELQLFGRVELLRARSLPAHAERPEQRARDAAQHAGRTDTAPGASRASASRQAAPRARRAAARALRHHLAEHDVRERQDGERETPAPARRRPMRDLREVRLEQRGQSVLAVHPEPEAGDRDAELRRRDVADPAARGASAGRAGARSASPRCGPRVRSADFGAPTSANSAATNSAFNSTNDAEEQRRPRRRSSGVPPSAGFAP